ncbi:MAG TPA: glycosyltransferase family 39 protein [Pyrinomonadaceae bacterium]|nr:glycosyltransferase family 39 protein [Pyrinomonadaceae bacterium]
MRHGVVVALLLVVASTVLCTRLGSTSLRSWDEAVYAECAREMVQSGDWLTVHWNGEKFFQKPPLFIWSTAILYKLFGVSEFTSRFASALCGIGVVILTFFMTRLFFNLVPAFLTSLMLLTSPAFFIVARWGMTDVMLTFFMSLALYAFLKCRDPRYWYLVGTALALATLTKGAAALPAVLVIAGAAIWTRPKSRHVWLGLLVFVLIAASWHVAMIYVHGMQFVKEYIGVQVVTRAVRTLDAETYSSLSYVPMLGFPLLLLPLGLLRLRQRRDIPSVVAVFALVIIAICIVVRTKHPWYILPALPAISTLIAPGNGSRVRPYLYCLLIGLNVLLLWRVNSAVTSDMPAHEKLVGLARQASNDEGPLGVYPDIDFGPEVRFYSYRRLCAEGDHTMVSMARCSPTHIIAWRSDQPSLSTKYALTPVAESGEFVYFRVAALGK